MGMELAKTRYVGKSGRYHVTLKWRRVLQYPSYPTRGA